MRDFEPQDRIIIAGNHPHRGTTGVLETFGPYGPASFKWQGWLVKLDNGCSCYAQKNELKRAP